MYTCTPRGAPSCHNSVCATHTDTQTHTEEDRCSLLSLMSALSAETEHKLTPPSFHYQRSIVAPSQRAKRLRGAALRLSVSQKHMSLRWRWRHRHHHRRRLGGGGERSVPVKPPANSSEPSRSSMFLSIFKWHLMCFQG